MKNLDTRIETTQETKVPSNSMAGEVKYQITFIEENEYLTIEAGNTMLLC